MSGFLALFVLALILAVAGARAAACLSRIVPPTKPGARGAAGVSRVVAAGVHAGSAISVDKYTHLAMLLAWDLRAHIPGAEGMTRGLAATAARVPVAQVSRRARGVGGGVAAGVHALTSQPDTRLVRFRAWFLHTYG